MTADNPTPRGRGRPPGSGPGRIYTEAVTLRLTPMQKAQLEAVAAREQADVGAMAREIVTAYLEGRSMVLSVRDARGLEEYRRDGETLEDVADDAISQSLGVWGRAGRRT